MSDLIRSKIRDAVFGLQDGLVSTLGATAGIAGLACAVGWAIGLAAKGIIP